MNNTLQSRFLVLFLFLLFATGKTATSPTQYVSKLKECMNANGAIFMEPEHEKVEVYFGCTAARGLLNYYTITGDTSCLNGSVRWIDWLIAHQEPEGYWYDYQNGGVDTVRPDSWDSYASLFLTLVHETRIALGGTTLLTPERQLAMQKAFNCIRGLVQHNGLTIAMPDYPAQYTMDNAEVYEGLKSIADDWRLLGETGLSTSADSLASIIQSNIRSKLWDANKKVYLVAFGESTPNLATWYPDIMAQLFPLRFGVETNTAPASVHILDTLKGMPLWSYDDFSTNYATPQGIPKDDVLHIAHFAMCAGDDAAATILTGVDNASIEWPVDLYIGWRLMLLEKVPTNASPNPAMSSIPITVMPNPASVGSRISIKSGIALQTMALYDLQGRLVERLCKAATPLNWKIKSALTSGCYLLHYSANNGQTGSLKLVQR